MDNSNLDPREKGLEEMTKEAFRTEEPSNALRLRVEQLAAAHDSRVRRPLWGSRGLRVASAFSLLLLVGWTTYKVLFNRPGEQAIQLIPADALLVVTLDTTPSPAQVPLFKRIDDALKAEHVEQSVDEQLSDVMKELPKVSAQIRPYVMHSFAFALLDGVGGRDWEHGVPVVFIALKDAPAVQAILDRNGGRRNGQGISYYPFQQGFSGALISRYLVLSSKPEALARVNAVYNQQLPSVAGLTEYQQSRSELPEDANFMLFVSPTALAAADEESKKLNVNPLRGTKWMAISGTLRDRGIVFDFRWPMDRSAMQGLKRYAEIRPIEPSAYHRLPAGPYGLMAFAQPGRLWDWAIDAAGDDAKSRAASQKEIGEFEKEIGISVTRDILPALAGNTWLAVYPHDASAGDWSPDGLILADDANGANASRLFDSVRTAIEKSTGKDGKGVRFIRTERNGAAVWQLDDQTQKQLNEGVNGAVEGMKDEGDDAAPKAHGRDWTVLVAQVDRSLIVATSNEMLDRAIAAYHGQGLTLADDPAYRTMRDMAVPGAQGVVMVNLASIMERLRGVLSKLNADGTATIAVDDVVKLFGTPDTGLVISSRYDGNEQVGSIFLPLEYERAIRAAAAIGREPKHPAHSDDL